MELGVLSNSVQVGIRNRLLAAIALLKRRVEQPQSSFRPGGRQGLFALCRQESIETGRLIKSLPSRILAYTQAQRLRVRGRRFRGLGGAYQRTREPGLHKTWVGLDGSAEADRGFFRVALLIFQEQATPVQGVRIAVIALQDLQKNLPCFLRPALGHQKAVVQAQVEILPTIGPRLGKGRVCFTISPQLR